MPDISTRRVHIKGIVQGVGFRPFVYAAAQEHHISGWVRNSSAGVEIVASGETTNLDLFLSHVKNQSPPLSQIEQFQWSQIEDQLFSGFSILASKTIPGAFMPISPDIAICDDCKHELFDPRDRRFRYPFINCTNCGPRLTIIKDIPYDRPLTTMADFPMCPPCMSEYETPSDRRFHAQPIACADCGPSIWFDDHHGHILRNEEGLKAARDLLLDGKILAIKGLGGFHLACDATNPQAVARLRERKRRSEKPFAVMGFNIQAIEKHCLLNRSESDLIQSKEKPIVIVEQKPTNELPDQIAPGRHTVGVMIAYTPLHLLLLEPAQGFPELFVMTSGNISEEPITYTNPDSMARLGDIADGFLLHDREIHIRIDDTVLAVANSQPYFFRRSRGFAPRSIHLPGNKKMVLATGAELKNTFCLTKKDYAFVSYHIGDLKNYETYQSFTEGIAHYCNIFKISPQQVACDLHPDYLSTKFAQEWSDTHHIPLVPTQHHHAHLASCLADNAYCDHKPVIGIIFDGTGYGTDGTIWGGEILVGDAKTFTRAYHLKSMPLPGGDSSVVKPSRIAIAYLLENNFDLDPGLAPVCATEKTELAVLKRLISTRLNTPLTSSMGRLFDAVASLIGLRQSISYEAQAAIELEQIVDPQIEEVYDFPIVGETITINALIEGILADLRSGIPTSKIAAKFHNGLAHLVLNLSQSIKSEQGINTVALSGGVWQNVILLEKTTALLESTGFSVLTHRQVPTNDGGISLGQVAILNALNKELR